MNSEFTIQISLQKENYPHGVFKQAVAETSATECSLGHVKSFLQETMYQFPIKKFYEKLINFKCYVGKELYRYHGLLKRPANGFQIKSNKILKTKND